MQRRHLVEMERFELLVKLFFLYIRKIMLDGENTYMTKPHHALIKTIGHIKTGSGKLKLHENNHLIATELTH